MRRLIGARHQLGQLHRAGCSFSLLTRETHMKPQINSAAATTRISPGWPHLEPSPTSKLVPGSRLPNAMPPPLCCSSDGWRHFLGTVHISSFDLAASILKPFISCALPSLQSAEPWGLSAEVPFYQESCYTIAPVNLSRA